MALDDVSLQWPAGQTLGVVGESGSGKTTLAMAILKLTRAHCTGRIEVGGQRIDGLDQRALRPIRRRMQMVFQDPFNALSPRMAVGSIVGEGLALHRPDLDGTAREAVVARALAEVGLDADMVSRYPHEFSGGQRQRLAIARALIVQPQVLVLDEPTSALDVTIQQQVLALLQRLQREKGLSYVLITHDVEVIRAMAHQVLVMKDGEIVENGAVAQVLNAPQHPYTQRLVAAALVL